MNEIVDRLVVRTAEDILSRRRTPETTYRIQFHAGFTFRDACAIVPYLHDLGITDCYASPYLKARPGSTHGYDIVDHQQLNPELGSEEDYEAFVSALAVRGMGQVLDMVPNHMGIIGNENVWWNDVLENGPASPFAGFFDIAWDASHRPGLQGRLLLPILGDPYGKALESGQLQVALDDAGFAIQYFEHRLPLDAQSYELILGERMEEFGSRFVADSPESIEYHSVLTAIRHLPPRAETSPEKIMERQREKEVIKRRLTKLIDDSSAVRDFVAETLARLNGIPGDSRSFDALDRLLGTQAYRLSYWRVAADEINYRRFFDVNELAALNMEREEVFTATHANVLRLLAEGKITGLRIDHIDGLFDPKEYLERVQQHFVAARARYLMETLPEFGESKWEDVEAAFLERVRRDLRPPGAAEASPGANQAAMGTQIVVANVPSSPLASLQAGNPLYVVVEKILGAGENLSSDWPVSGTTGYEFLNHVNGLFLKAGNAETLTKMYFEFIQDDVPFVELAYRCKRLIMQVAMSSELQMLAHELYRLAQKDRLSRDLTLNSLRSALREIIANFPVYRSYICNGEPRDTDRRYVLRAIHRAKARNPAVNRDLFHYVRDMLLLRYPEWAGEADRLEQRRFTGKFQQVTSPVMAKGVEDTAFYAYNRLLSLNEVGGDPSGLGISSTLLHEALRERGKSTPHALSPLSTHDTKRGEDVRARLNVLSELAGEWRDRVFHWCKINASHRVMVEDSTAPDANEEYLLYQTLVGAWPFEPCNEEEYAEFIRRIQAYMVKALHEAKVHTSWINPVAAYDDAVRQFVARILDPSSGAEFLRDFRPFQRRVSQYGVINSLAQTVIRITAPGVPDTYQGTELWDFSLVDPDNRRPVDYERRARILREINETVAKAENRLTSVVREMLDRIEDGRLKLYITQRGLAYRRDHPGMLSGGEYLPVECRGERDDHVFAFIRRRQWQWMLVVIPRLITGLPPSNHRMPLGVESWGDTRLTLPDDAPGTWMNLFTGENVGARNREIPVAQVLATLPVAVFVPASG